MLSKVALLAEVHKLLYFDGGDYLDEPTLSQLQDLVHMELEQEGDAGNCTLTKLDNGFIKEVAEIADLYVTSNLCVVYDDKLYQVVENVNKVLSKVGLQFKNDGENYDGFMTTYRLEKKICEQTAK